MTENLPINAIYAVTNNAITSEASSIFSWNKKQWKPNKMVFLMIYYFIYFKENVFPKYALIFRTLRKFGNFHRFREVSSIFCLMWLEWTPLFVSQRIRTNTYTFIYFAEKFFPKFAWRFQMLQKFGHFFIIIFHSFL